MQLFPISPPDIHHFTLTLQLYLQFFVAHRVGDLTLLDDPVWPGWECVS